MSSAATQSLASSTCASVWKPSKGPLPHMSPVRKKMRISALSVSSQSVPLARERNTAATSSGVLVSASSPCAREGRSSKVSTRRILPRFEQGLGRENLSERFVDRDTGAGGEVQAAGRRILDHRHAHAALREPVQQLRGKAVHLVAEHEEVSGAKARLPERRFGAAGEEVQAVDRRLLGRQQPVEPAPEGGQDTFPVAAARGAQALVFESPSH